MKDLENSLSAELREIAEGIRVPAMPHLPTDKAEPRFARVWPPVLAAAAVALIIGVATFAIGQRPDGETQPAGPSPTGPSETPGGPKPVTGEERIPGTAPTVPYLLDQELYVDGAQVPGVWWTVESRGQVWTALKQDGSWWWGGPQIGPTAIPAQIDQSPVISPNGQWIAYVGNEAGRASVTGFDTRPAGEGLGAAPIDLPAQEDGVSLLASAVTDEGDIFVRGPRTSLVWRATFGSQQTIFDLAETAPDQVVLGSSADGLVVVDGSDGAVDATEVAPYLAAFDPEQGELARTGTLPTYDDLLISPAGTQLVRSPAGTLGGEVTSVRTLNTQPVGGGEEVLLEAPSGRGFATGTWAWEDDDNLIAVLRSEGSPDEGDVGLVRCRVSLAMCREIDADPSETLPSAAASPSAGSFTAEETLNSVLAAASKTNRSGLVDPGVISDRDWDQLLALVDGQPGRTVPGCRDNGGGSKDCEIELEADPSTVYYAIVDPAENAYGWKISYLGISDG